VVAQVRDCVSVTASPACPLPDERYVPGSVHGTVQAGVRATNTDLDSRSAVGRLVFSGRLTVNGSYRRLNFSNLQVAGHGPVYLDIHATAYAVAPLHLRWTSS
jgi:hypothetical protein